MAFGRKYLTLNPGLGRGLAVGKWANPETAQDILIYKLKEMISCPKASCKDHPRWWVKTPHCNQGWKEHLTNVGFHSLLWPLVQSFEDWDLYPTKAYLWRICMALEEFQGDIPYMIPQTSFSLYLLSVMLGRFYLSSGFHNHKNRDNTHLVYLYGK